MPSSCEALARATINITQYEFRQHDVLLLEPGSFLLIHEFSEDALVYYVLFLPPLWRSMPSRAVCR